MIPIVLHVSPESGDIVSILSRITRKWRHCVHLVTYHQKVETLCQSCHVSPESGDIVSILSRITREWRHCVNLVTYHQRVETLCQSCHVSPESGDIVSILSRITREWRHCVHLVTYHSLPVVQSLVYLWVSPDWRQREVADLTRPVIDVLVAGPVNQGQEGGAWRSVLKQGGRWGGVE